MALFIEIVGFDAEVDLGEVPKEEPTLPEQYIWRPVSVVSNCIASLMFYYLGWRQLMFGSSYLDTGNKQMVMYTTWEMKCHLDIWEMNLFIVYTLVQIVLRPSG